MQSNFILFQCWMHRPWRRKNPHSIMEYKFKKHQKIMYFISCRGIYLFLRDERTKRGVNQNIWGKVSVSLFTLKKNQNPLVFRQGENSFWRKRRWIALGFFGEGSWGSCFVVFFLGFFGVVFFFFKPLVLH